VSAAACFSASSPPHHGAGYDHRDHRGHGCDRQIIIITIIVGMIIVDSCECISRSMLVGTNSRAFALMKRGPLASGGVCRSDTIQSRCSFSPSITIVSDMDFSLCAGRTDTLMPNCKLHKEDGGAFDGDHEGKEPLRPLELFFAQAALNLRVICRCDRLYRARFSGIWRLRQMPVMSKGPLCSAGTHDQTDRDAGDHALLRA